MRNVFDQYSQPENRLTHALGTLLHEEQKALRSFLKVAGANPPKGKRLVVLEQSLPGFDTDNSEDERLGLPDLWIHDIEESWCLLVECKGEGKVTYNQLHRHKRTAERRDFQKIDLLALTVQESTRKLPVGTQRLLWSEVYAWAKGLPSAKTHVKTLAQPSAISWADLKRFGMDPKVPGRGSRWSRCWRGWGRGGRRTSIAPAPRRVAFCRLAIKLYSPNL